jgi:TonB family protein
MDATSHQRPVDDIYSLEEIARAAGVAASRIEELAAQGEIATIGAFDGAASFVSYPEAVQAVRAVKLNQGPSPARARPPGGVPQPSLFGLPQTARRSAGMPIMCSTLVHAAVIAAMAIATSVGLTPASAAQQDLIEEKTPIRLVYVAAPGPGGGGGGGGLKQRTPPPKAERKGKARISSPLPARAEPEPIVAVQEPPEPPPPTLKAEPLPRIVAPVATAPANDRDRAGVLEATTARADSRGPGAGGGVGTGTGTGIGEGDGSGIGPGSGGGTGGGPYRPGSGITPPRLLREVKPDYTEEARQHGVEGEVVLEIVVSRAGSVGDVRLVSGLGHGLNERAMAAVRQWRFAPAQRRGAPVDVLAEVAVEFRLR